MCQRDLIWDTVDKLRDSEETVLSVPCNDYVVETTMVWIKGSQHAPRLAPAHIYSAEGSNPNTHNAVKNRPAPKQGGLQSAVPLQPPVVMAPTYRVSRTPQATFYGAMPFSQIPPAGAVGIDDEER